MNTEEKCQEIYSRIGRNILFFRSKMNLTQTQLANQLYYSQSLISQYESGKAISLDRIISFSTFFNIPICDFMFVDFSKSNYDTECSENTLSDTDPIYKCANRTYFGYYIKEDTPEKSKITTSISRFEIRIGSPKSMDSADVQITLPGKQKKKLNGTLVMDSSYAYIEARNLKKDFYFAITYFYYRQKDSRYVGGLGLLRTMDDNHALPICQYCILSINEIAEKKHLSLEQLLKTNAQADCKQRLSKQSFSSSAIFRLTKSKDAEVFSWLRQNVGV